MSAINRRALFRVLLVIVAIQPGLLFGQTAPVPGDPQPESVQTTAAAPSTASPTAPAPSAGGPAQRHYIVILKPGKGADPDIALAGGSVQLKQYNWMLVTLPDPAVEQLRKHDRVKYIQQATAPGEAPPSREESPKMTAQSLAPESSRRLLAPNGTGSWSTGTMTYDGVGDITAMGTTLGGGSLNSDGKSNTFTYDVFGRVKQGTANYAAGNFSQAYEYDSFGNMTRITTTDPTGVYPNPIAVNHATNRLDTQTPGVTYDAAGNLTSDSIDVQRRFDSLNLMTEKAPVSGGEEFYIYTAANERIGVKTSSSWWTWTLRDEEGRVLRQYQSLAFGGQGTDWLWIEDYAYRGGQLLAAERVAEEGGRRHFHLDQLGTPRLETGPNGGLMARHDYLPFGQEVTSIRQDLDAGYDRIDPMQFTGHERDFQGTQSYSGDYLEYMHARYYESLAARFFSVDPELGTPENPQSWNRYAYALNNPINLTDPTGMHDDDCGIFGGCVSFTSSDEELNAWILSQGGTVEDTYKETFYGSITVTASAMPASTAADVAADTVDGIGFTLFDMSGYGNWAHGLITDNPVEMAKGTAKAMMWGLGVPEAEAPAATAEVWLSIKGTQEVIEGTVIPKSFEMITENGAVWVHPNATEHLGEYATGMLDRGVSPELVNLGSQAQLSSLHSAVEEAIARGVPTDRLVMVGDWELKFAEARTPGQLPVLIHAMLHP